MLNDFIHLLITECGKLRKEITAGTEIFPVILVILSVSEPT